MDLCLWDLLYEWAFRNHPLLLDDEPAFQNLHELIHVLLQRQKKQEVRRLYAKLTKVSRN